MSAPPDATGSPPPPAERGGRGGGPARRADRSGVERIVLGADGIELSALLARPAGPPRALVLALHGGGMHAGYFNGQAHPSVSLLAVGAALGFTVLAVDRPGYGRSADTAPGGRTLAEQAETVFAALDGFTADNPVGGGVFVIAHSYGMKLALTMAAHQRGADLLGIDASGAGYRYHRDVGVGEEGAIVDVARPSQRELFWGPLRLYPPGTFDSRWQPTAPVPEAEAKEAPTWPEVFPLLAPRLVVPFRYTVAEHEKWWETGPAALAEMRLMLSGAPRLELGVQRHAGHNISLSWSARSYHLKALAFAEECLLDRRPPATRTR